MALVCFGLFYVREDSDGLTSTCQNTKKMLFEDSPIEVVE